MMMMIKSMTMMMRMMTTMMKLKKTMVIMMPKMADGYMINAIKSMTGGIINSKMSLWLVV